MNNFLKELQLNEKFPLLSKILSDKYLFFPNQRLTLVALWFAFQQGPDVTHSIPSRAAHVSGFGHRCCS